jgi:hypothetical protein
VTSAQLGINNKEILKTKQRQNFIFQQAFFYFFYVVSKRVSSNSLNIDDFAILFFLLGVAIGNVQYAEGGNIKTFAKSSIISECTSPDRELYGVL